MKGPSSNVSKKREPTLDEIVADRWAALLPPVTPVYDPAREMTVKDFQKRTKWGCARVLKWFAAEVAAGRWEPLEVLDGQHRARAWRPVAGKL
jgi:hypothetical protein